MEKKNNKMIEKRNELREPLKKKHLVNSTPFEVVGGWDSTIMEKLESGEKLKDIAFNGNLYVKEEHTQNILDFLKADGNIPELKDLEVHRKVMPEIINLCGFVLYENRRNLLGASMKRVSETYSTVKDALSLCEELIKLFQELKEDRNFLVADIGNLKYKYKMVGPLRFSNPFVETIEQHQKSLADTRNHLKEVYRRIGRPQKGGGKVISHSFDIVYVLGNIYFQATGKLPEVKANGSDFSKTSKFSMILDRFYKDTYWKEMLRPTSKKTAKDAIKHLCADISNNNINYKGYPLTLKFVKIIKTRKNKAKIDKKS